MNIPSGKTIVVMFRLVAAEMLRRGYQDITTRDVAAVNHLLLAEREIEDTAGRDIAMLLRTWPATRADLNLLNRSDIVFATKGRLKPEVSLSDTVEAGERVRREMHDSMQMAKISERASFLTEIIMFYGQAFRDVHQILMENTPSGMRTAKISQECVSGSALHQIWIESETSLDAQEEYGRMTRHWHTITKLVRLENS